MGEERCCAEKRAVEAENWRLEIGVGTRRRRRGLELRYKEIALHCKQRRVPVGMGTLKIDSGQSIGDALPHTTTVM
jgi:hypothetical protein